MKNTNRFQTFQRVAIFGSADISESHPLYKDAYLAAQAVVHAGAAVVNGGGPGVMKAATDGARAAGGTTLTISFQPKDAPFFEGPDSDNHADEDIPATNYPDRLHLLIDHSDGFIVLNGGTGTLSEWGAIWLMAHIHYGTHKPFVLVGDFWHEILSAITKHMFIGKEEKLVYTIVKSAEEAVPALVELEENLLALQKKTAKK